MPIAPLSSYIRKIEAIAQNARSESKLEGEFNQLLKELLGEFNIEYDPAVNETLKALGFNSVTHYGSNRPDSVFGHVVLDYKEPGILSHPPEVASACSQVERYLSVISESQSVSQSNPDRWAGILFDGKFLIFCHSDGQAWRWTKPYEVSEASLLTLIQTYRSLDRIPLSAEQLNRYFGKGSRVIEHVIPVLINLLSRPSQRTQILFKEWEKLFEQVSAYDFSQIPSMRRWAGQYGGQSDRASNVMFAIHTYYSIVVKLLTAELLAGTRGLSGSIVAGIANARSNEALFDLFRRLENGDIYKHYRLTNFLEGDFFSWYVEETSPELAGALLEVAQVFQNFEPATAKLKPECIKDLLKAFYSGIVEDQIRHDLGEYYTPDWLAQHVLDSVGYTGEPGKVLIDPACGSGTFVVESIARLRATCERREFPPIRILDTITDCIYGIDINPLAVISARANYVLAISDLIFDLGQDVEIPIYLSDAIYVPQEQGDFLTYNLDTAVGVIPLRFPAKLVRKPLLGLVMATCQDYIDQERSPEQFILALRRLPDVSHHLGDDRETQECLVEFYAAIQGLHNRRPPWDSIWCKILKQNFSPKGFKEADYIVGNPPWVRWSRLPNSYRTRVKDFCQRYGLVSGGSYSGGIESDISTVLVFSAADNWLRTGGKAGVLITSTVFKSSSAAGFRRGELPDGSGLCIRQIEDLSRLQPFEDASTQTSIYIAEKVRSSTEVPQDEIACKLWSPLGSARLNPYATLTAIRSEVRIEDGIASPVAQFGSPFFIGRKRDYDAAHSLRGRSEYLSKARRGTVNDMARVYWLKVERYASETGRALVRTLSETELGKARVVRETPGAWIEAELLHPLARGREVGRYAFRPAGWYQLIPNRAYSGGMSEEEFAGRYPAAYDYLMQYADLLPNRATYRRYLRELPLYSIYCIGEYSFMPYKVVWPELQDAGKFRAAVVSELEGSVIPNRVIVPDHKLYSIGSENPDEVHYLCAVLNSRPVRAWLGGFMLSRQVGASIFEYMNIPLFNSNNADHRALAELSIQVHADRCGGRSDEYLDEPKERMLEEIIYALTT